MSGTESAGGLKGLWDGRGGNICVCVCVQKQLCLHKAGLLPMCELLQMSPSLPCCADLLQEVLLQACCGFVGVVLGMWLVGMGWQLDLMVLEISFKLYRSVILGV